LDVSTLSAAQAVAAPTNTTGTLRAVPSTLPNEARATVNKQPLTQLSTSKARSTLFLWSDKFEIRALRGTGFYT